MFCCQVSLEVFVSHLELLNALVILFICFEPRGARGVDGGVVEGKGSMIARKTMVMMNVYGH